LPVMHLRSTYLSFSISLALPVSLSIFALCKTLVWCDRLQITALYFLLHSSFNGRMSREESERRGILPAHMCPQSAPFLQGR
jgi:hypothetical protein